MRILPFENIEFKSPLQNSEIVMVIKSNVARTKIFGNAFSKNTTKEYEGYMKGNTFKIRRILKWGQNSFIPIVTGTVSEDNIGTSKIPLKIRFHRLVIVLLSIVTLFSILIFLVDFFNRPINNQGLTDVFKEHKITSIELPDNSRPFEWKTIAIILFPYLLSIIFFNYEAKRVKDKLKMILELK